MLENVVASKDGTGFRAAVPGYSVAGKTGTARKPNDNGIPGYKTGAYVSSFAGYLPAENPQVSIIVVIDEPSTSIYASVVSAPVFAELANLAVRQLRIAPAGALPSGATDVAPDVAPGTAPLPPTSPTPDRRRCCHRRRLIDTRASVDAVARGGPRATPRRVSRPGGLGRGR